MTGSCEKEYHQSIHPIKVGSLTKPVPGYDVEVLDRNGEKVSLGIGRIVAVKLPLPP